MTQEIEFTFEELPLLVEGGFEAGLVNGSATISYYADGEWFVNRIFLDGSKRNGPRLEYKPVEIDNDKSQLFLAIWGQLTDGRFKDHIHDMVMAALAEDGVSFRTDRQEHCTYHGAP